MDRFSIRTQRLLLRRWKEEDKIPLAALNADPRVMEFFPNVLSKEESDAHYDRIQAHWKQHGFGRFALEIPGRVPFIGVLGIAAPSFQNHFTPCFEIGWRLAAEHHGKGYATEAAHAVMDYAFRTLKLKEVVSFTVPANVKSWKVMEKIGMTFVEEFMHPQVEGPLKKHVLFKKMAPFV